MAANVRLIQDIANGGNGKIDEIGIMMAA